MNPNEDGVIGQGGIIGWWARNSVAANLVMVLTILSGVVGYIFIERVVFPSFGWNGVSISVAWPGAAPQEIEEQIVVRMEEAVADLEGIKRITSRATEGSGTVSIEAKQGVDIPELVDEIKLRVDAVNNLPPSAYRPVVRRWQAESIFMGVALAGDVDRLQIKRLSEEIRRDIAKLPGGSRAQVWGVLPEEVTIEVSESALRRYSMTFDEVAGAIRQSSINASSGSVRTDTGDVTLSARNQADSAVAFEDIVIRQSADGGIIRVRDVAEVIDGFTDDNLETTFNGKPNALIVVPTLENNMNVVRTQKAIVEYIAEKNKELPPGVSLEMWWDDSEVYFDRIQSIGKNAAMGLALVFIVLILFLRPTVAIWTTAGIAVSFAGTFAILPLLDVSLNMLTLFAFLIVIGIVVDDAIVVGENIHNQVERGEGGVNAAIVGTQLVAKPVIFAVVTTMMAFGPWMLLSGPEVQFTRQITLVVIAALFFSLVESFIILPNHLAHMKKQRFDGFWGPFLRFQRGVADSLIGFAKHVYQPGAMFAIRFRYATLAFFIALFMLSMGTWMAAGWVKFRFMPEVESDFLHVDIVMPDGTPFSRVQRVRDQLEAAEDRFMAKVNAEHEDEVKLVETTNSIAYDGEVEAWIGLADPEDRPKGLSTREIAERLREELGPIPDAEEVNIDFTFNDEQSGVRFSLQSKDLDALRAAAEDLKSKLATYDAIFEVRDNLQAAADEAQIALKPGAESLGLTLADVTRQVRQAFYGEEVQRLPRDGEDVRVMARLPKEARESLDVLQSFRLRMSDGREVPLSAVAEVEFAPGIKRINRRDRERSISVRADVRGDETPNIMKDLNETFFPEWEIRHPAVTREVGGAQQSQQEFMSEILVLQGIMLIAMFSLLAIAFRSIFQPLLVMTAIPFALTGALIGHLVTGTPMALFSFFGIGAAAGVVINDNLVLIDYVNRLRIQGAGAMQALVEAGVARFRPILLTSVTTFVGIAPMMAERSTQAQFLKPMVVSLAFAVAFALFLTLFLVPALYAIGTDVARLWRWAWKKEAFHPIGSGFEPYKTFGDMGVTASEDGDGHPAPAE